MKDRQQKQHIGGRINDGDRDRNGVIQTDLGLGPHPDDPMPPVITPLPSARAGKDVTPTPRPEDALRGSQGVH